MNNSAISWVDAITFSGEDAFTLQLVDLGYDIWFGNNRGSIYSNRHERDGEWSADERWSFSFADMGTYDMRANVSEILNLTKKPKLTLIGAS